jgi:hypothetical protein
MLGAVSAELTAAAGVSGAGACAHNQAGASKAIKMDQRGRRMVFTDHPYESPFIWPYFHFIVELFNFVETDLGSVLSRQSNPIWCKRPHKS